MPALDPFCHPWSKAVVEKRIAAARCSSADGPVYLGYMRFVSTPPAPPCCEYPIIKAESDLYPDIDGPIMVLCSNPNDVIGVFVDAVINPDPECACALVLPADEQTWGRVKALYR